MLFRTRRPGRERPEDLLAEAAIWLSEIQDPKCSAEHYSSWLEWLEADPDHVQAFDDVTVASTAVSKYKEDLRSVPIPDDAALDADRYDAQMPVSKWQKRDRRISVPLSVRPRPTLLLQMVAMLAIGVIGLSILAHHNLSTTPIRSYAANYETAKAEYQKEELDDGSTIDIGPVSSLAINFTSENRTVVLGTGEATFSVAKAENRPFVVVAGPGTITAIGTQFNVRRDSNRVVISVLEGSVTVKPHSRTFFAPGASSADFPPDEPLRLTAGQQAIYDETGVLRVGTADPGVVTSWQTGRLQYLREPLRFVVTGINRYSEAEIVIADSELEELEFTGTVFPGQTDEWLQSLAAVAPLRVERIGDNTIVLRKID